MKMEKISVFGEWRLAYREPEAQMSARRQNGGPANPCNMETTLLIILLFVKLFMTVVTTAATDQKE
jgi:hypothetical protein